MAHDRDPVSPSPMVTRKQIENRVFDLLIEYGPDGHCDGFEEITDYIVELLQSGSQLADDDQREA
jgi:hypothetical protein